MTHREPYSVKADPLTCHQVDERDLEAAYVGGRLTEADALRFEAHVFACDRCWRKLQVALAVTALAAAPATPARPRGTWLPWSLASAAAVATVVLGTWWLAARRSDRDSPAAMRGVRDSIGVQAAVTGRGVAIRFSGFAGADRYRVRLFTPDGSVVAERETPDTVLEFSLLAQSPASFGTLVAEVTALDVLRQPMASSGLVPLRQSPPIR